MSKLMTTSLISSVDWFLKSPPSWKEKAYNDLFMQLSRIYPKEMPFPVKRGLDFEDNVQKVVEAGNVETIKSSEKFKEVCRYCVGGQFQVTSKSFIEVDGVEYCLYGRIDNKKTDLIIDIKATAKFKESKYTDSFQHKIYCFNEKIPSFLYVVAEFEGDTDKIKEVHGVTVYSPDFNLLENEIIEKIRETMYTINGDEDLKKLYNTKFCRF